MSYLSWQRLVAGGLVLSVSLLANTSVAQGKRGGGEVTGPKYNWLWLPAGTVPKKISNRGDMIGGEVVTLMDASGNLIPVNLREHLVSEGLILPVDEVSQTGIDYVEIHDINGFRQITGVVAEARPEHPYTVYRAFFYSPGSFDYTPHPESKLVFLQNHNFASRSVVLNDNGVVATQDIDQQVYTWSLTNGYDWLGNPYGSAVSAINSSGVICGWDFEPWRYEPEIGFLRLKTKSNIYAGEARDINDRGQITGHIDTSSTYDSPNDRLPYREEANGTVTMIKLPNKQGRGWARAINNSGDALGWGHLDSSNGRRGFLYSDTYGLVDLMAAVQNLPPELAEVSSWTYADVWDINDAGIIVGNIINGDGFMLVPVTP
jgi:hypothetical protein